MAALAVALAVLLLSGAVPVWQVFLIAFGLGLATVVDNPARQTFVNELVPPSLILTLSLAQFRNLSGFHSSGQPSLVH